MVKQKRLNQEEANELLRIVGMKSSEKIHSQGTVFNSTYKNYYYDAGTGRICTIDDDTHHIMSKLFGWNRTPEELETEIFDAPIDVLKKFLSFVIEYSLFRRPSVLGFKPTWYDSFGTLVNTQLEQITLEVTEACNFRCKYCVYSEDNSKSRDFGNSKMSWEIAKKSIDYALLHSGEEIAITYYGGEPILEFELVKKTTEYALLEAKKRAKTVSFNMTSNMSLITGEIAKYIASTPNFHFLASIDGPQNIHDNARVYANNRATFQDVMNGLSVLSKEFKKANRVFNMNAVVIPPYSYEKFEEMNDFFNSLELPDSSTLNVSYAETGTYDDSDYLRKEINNPKYDVFGEYNPLLKWQLRKAIEKGLSWHDKPNVYFRPILESVIGLHSCGFTKEPSHKESIIHANCIPGQRKLYVTTRGDFKVCERIHNSPILGTVHTGIDIELTKKLYIDEYLQKAEMHCEECWAINCCQICYAQCFSADGIDEERFKSVCDASRRHLRTRFSYALSLLDEHPEVLSIVEKTVLV